MTDKELDKISDTRIEQFETLLNSWAEAKTRQDMTPGWDNVPSADELDARAAAERETYYTVESFVEQHSHGRANLYYLTSLLEAWYLAKKCYSAPIAVSAYRASPQILINLRAMNAMRATVIDFVKAALDVDGEYAKIEREWQAVYGGKE
jgi:hypothetical protein